MATKRKPGRGKLLNTGLIDYLMEERGLSLREFAARAGLTQQCLSQVLSERGNPTLSTLLKMSHALGVPVFRMINEETGVRE